MGLVKEYDIGTFDRDLTMEPDGYDSVKGFIRRGIEYVVFANDRVYASHIIIYRFSDTILEMSPAFNTPPEVTGKIVYITVVLSDFFSKLQREAAKANDDATSKNVKRLIGLLLKRRIDVEAFLTQISEIIKAPHPAELPAKLNAELSKCNYGQLNPAATTPTT